MSTVAGNAGESRAAKYLEDNKFKIVDRNWRTRYCEIDIIAQKNQTIWFIEVKSRRSSSQGYGYEYVTSKKLKQMQFAAEMWVSSNSWNGEYRLGVVSVDGDTIEFIEDL